MNGKGRVSIWMIGIAILLALVLLQLCGGRNLVSVVTETTLTMPVPVADRAQATAVQLRKEAIPHPNVTVVTLQGYEYLEDELVK